MTEEGKLAGACTERQKYFLGYDQTKTLCQGLSVSVDSTAVGLRAPAPTSILAVHTQDGQVRKSRPQSLHKILHVRTSEIARDANISSVLIKSVVFRIITGLLQCQVNVFHNTKNGQILTARTGTSVMNTFACSTEMNRARESHRSQH